MTAQLNFNETQPIEKDKLKISLRVETQKEPITIIILNCFYQKVS